MLIHHISVDFNTEHKCKNFDAIREWAKERQLPESVEPDFLEPPVAGDRIFDEIPWAIFWVLGRSSFFNMRSLEAVYIQQSQKWSQVGWREIRHWPPSGILGELPRLQITL